MANKLRDFFSFGKSRAFRGSTFGFYGHQRVLPNYSKKMENPYLQHPYAHGAIRLAAQMLASVPFEVVREVSLSRDIQRAETREDLDLLLRKQAALRAVGPKSERSPTATWEPVPNHPLSNLFQRPSADSGTSDLFNQTMIHLLTEGNAIVLYLGGTDRVMEEGAMPTEVRVYGRKGWTFENNTWSVQSATGKGGIESLSYPAHQVTHLRLFNPEGGMWGVSPLVAADLKLEQDILADAWNNAFFRQGAEAGGILTSTEPLGRKDAESIRDVFEQRHQGAANRGKTAILTGGLSYDRNPVTQRDMEFSTMLQANRDAILAALLVHKAALGVTDQLNRATITEARRMVWTNLLLPTASYIEDRLFVSLFSRLDKSGVKGIFNTSGVPELADDLQVKATTAQTLTNIGVPLNDAVSLLNLNLPEYDWGGEAYAPSGLVPYKFLEDPFSGMEVESGEPTPTTATGSANVVEGVKLNGAQITAAKDIATEVTEGLLSPDIGLELLQGVGLTEDKAQTIISAATTFTPKPQPQDARSSKRSVEDRGFDAEEWWSRAVGDDEKSFRSAYRNHVWEIRKKVLEELGDDRSSERALDGKEITALLKALEQMAPKLLERFRSIYEALIRRNVELLSEELQKEGLPPINLGDEQVSGAFSFPDSYVERIVEDRILILGKVNDTILKNIEKSLNESRGRGDTIQETAKGIREVTNGMVQPARSLAIARTESAAISNEARFVGMKEAGVERKIWLTARDEEVRESHQSNEGVEVGIDERFPNGLLFPGDKTGIKNGKPVDAGEVVNCRCAFRTVVPSPPPSSEDA
jgi:HK97 family phage portal protein